MSVENEMEREYFNSSCMRPSHGGTTPKQEAHKLNVSIIKLFNPNIRYVSR